MENNLKYEIVNKKKAFEQLMTLIVQSILGLYLLSIGIIYMYGIDLEIESTLLGKEKKELIKTIPVIGNIIIENLTINIISIFILFLTSVILVFINIGNKMRGQSFFEILITILGVYGININKEIIQEIQKYKDIIYENKWFAVRKIYTLGEKSEYMIKEIKEYCLLNEMKYNKEYEKIIEKKIGKIGIEEIPKLVESELEKIKKLADKTAADIAAAAAGGFQYKYVIYLGIGIAVVVGGYYAYQAFLKAMDSSPEQNFSESITNIIKEQGNNTMKMSEIVKDMGKATKEVVSNHATSTANTLLEQNNLIEKQNKILENVLKASEQHEKTLLEQDIDLINLRAQFKFFTDYVTKQVTSLINHVNTLEDTVTKLNNDSDALVTQVSKVSLDLHSTQECVKIGLQKVLDYTDKQILEVSNNTNPYTPTVVNPLIKKITENKPTSLNFGSGFATSDITMNAMELSNKVIENIN